MKIGVITITDHRYEPVDDITSPVNLQYCKDHGYEFTPILLTKDRTWAETVWHKIPVMTEWLSRYDWLMWIDADAMVMNHTIKIERLIEQTNAANISLIVSSDENGLNAGVFLVKNCEWSRKYLEAVDSVKPLFIDKKYPEQMAMDKVLRNDSRDSYYHVAYLPKWLLNQFWCTWLPGDFIVHHAGGSVEDKVEGLTPFLDKVIYA